MPNLTIKNGNANSGFDTMTTRYFDNDSRKWLALPQSKSFVTNVIQTLTFVTLVSGKADYPYGGYA